MRYRTVPFFAPFMLAALLALALLGTVGCAGVPTATFNDKAALAERGVQAVQTTATALLRAGKLTVEQDRAIQANVQLAHDSIVLAKKLQATDPAAADAALQSADLNIKTLKQKTGVQP